MAKKELSKKQMDKVSGGGAVAAMDAADPKAIAKPVRGAVAVNGASAVAPMDPYEQKKPVAKRSGLFGAVANLFKFGQK